MKEPFKSGWKRSFVMMAMFVTFVVGYYTGGALKPPQIKQLVARDIAVQVAYLPMEEYDQLETRKYEERMAELRTEREKWRVERKLFREAEHDFDKLLMTEEFAQTCFDKLLLTDVLEKAFDEEIEKEIARRIAQRTAVPNK